MRQAVSMARIDVAWVSVSVTLELKLKRQEELQRTP